MSALFEFPPPDQEGFLDVGDGQQVWFSVAGAPGGLPAVVLHGGPGQGSSPNMRRAFDPEKWRVVVFDQRQCGRSLPHASDVASADLRVNTTDHLIADLEVLRQYLGHATWLVAGASWGTTLALAYAQKHSARVTAMVLHAVTTTRRSEIDWLYRGVRRFFPDHWERFASHVGVDACTDSDLLVAYAKRLSSPDHDERVAAARAWCAWEDAVLSMEPNPVGSLLSMNEDEIVAFARICAHYFSNGAWLDEGQLIANANILRGIPGVLIHGRRDMSGPLDTAWDLAKAWPGSELIVLEGGHGGSESLRAALIESFARLRLVIER